MKLLVIGLPGSGTRFTAHFCQKLLNLEVTHENQLPFPGKHGLVAWPAAVEGEYMRRLGWTLSYSDFSVIVHLVRHPVHNINSMIAHRLNLPAWQWLDEFGLNPLKIGWQRFYLEWNARIEKIAHFRIRVEDLPTKGLNRWSMKSHVDYGTLTEKELNPKVVELARKYGYLL